MAQRWWHGWTPLILLPVAAVLAVPRAWPHWAFMWILALAIFVGCKWLTWRRTCNSRASSGLQIGYLIAWPGMDAVTFLGARPAGNCLKPMPSEWMSATAKLAIGLVLVFGLTRWIPEENPYLVGWVGMLGVILMLHFGTFHLLSCGWRSAGVEARPVMYRPLVSVSVSEFWGRRWNTAYRELTHRFLFRPLSKRLGVRSALCAGFLVSGLVHDFLISVPAGGGYGLPSLFFAIQGMAIFVERSALGQWIGLGQGCRGWLFTMFVLVAPVGLLFHSPFVLEIVVPFLKAMRVV